MAMNIFLVAISRIVASVAVDGMQNKTKQNKTILGIV